MVGEVTGFLMPPTLSSSSRAAPMASSSAPVALCPLPPVLFSVCSSRSSEDLTLQASRKTPLRWMPDSERCDRTAAADTAAWEERKFVVGDAGCSLVGENVAGAVVNAEAEATAETMMSPPARGIPSQLPCGMWFWRWQVRKQLTSHFPFQFSSSRRR